MSDLWSGKDGARQPEPEPDPDDLWSGAGTRATAARRPVLDRITIVARVVLAVVILGGLVVVGWVGVDLLSVRSSLVEARGAIVEVRTSFGDVDADGGSSALQRAGEEIADAEQRAGRVTWTIASGLPFLGPSVQVTREVVEVAASAVDVASIALRDGQELLTDGLGVAVADGEVDLTPLLAARELVAELPIERLSEARDALAQPRDRWVPEEVRQGRADTLALADETLELLERAEALTAALPGFLGAEGPQRYFVGMQTSAELRGTGGLIGYWAILTIDDGRITFGQSEVYDPFDGDASTPSDEQRVGRIRGIGLLAPENPPDADPAFLARYGHLAAARSFPNVNLDPDLPTSAKAILDLIELRTEQRLDGVILIDPLGLQALLEPTGDSLPISDDLAQTFDHSDGLPVDDFARFVTADIYDTLGSDQSDARNDALREIGDAAFVQVVQGGWDGPSMVSAIADATVQRHLQVFTSDENVQAAFRAVGATGELDLAVGSDSFAITANNVVGGKQDVHLGHEFRFAIDLERMIVDDDSLSVRRRSMVDVTVDNPLPSSGRDEYIIGNCYLPGRENRCFEGEPGNNRTWFSMWMPPETRVMGFGSDDGTRPRTFGTTFRDHRVVDHFLLPPSEDRASFSFDVDGEVEVHRHLDTVVYEFTWWRQSKAIPDHLDVRVAPPTGWAITDVEVVGGGSGRGLGVHGDGEELVGEVSDGIAEVRGTVTADTRVRVHLVPAEAA